MQGYLIDKNGTEYRLGGLLSWDICHGMGEPCDYFELVALYDTQMRSKLYSATRFKAMSNGNTVFYGVVDEYLVSINEKGATVSINGRSLAALLMDNQVEAKNWFQMSKSNFISNYLTPFGISNIENDTMDSVSIFRVKSSDSAWSALKRFCLKSAQSCPRFTPAGKLLLKEHSGTTLSIDADSEASSVKYKDERYGIISSITVTNRANGGSYTLSNTPFINRGGSCKRYLYTEKFDSVVSGIVDGSEHFTGEYQIQQSEKGKNVIEVSVPKQFLCFPGDTVSFSSSALGLSGSYTVTATHCWADAVSAGTLVTMEV